mgnify:CR=1 FL=1
MSLEVSGVNFEKLFASIDAMDTESFLGFIAEDCTFRFGSSPPGTGRDGIPAAVGEFFAVFGARGQELGRVVGDERGGVGVGGVR